MTTLLKSISCLPVSLRASRALCDLTTGLPPALPSLALLCAHWHSAVSWTCYFLPGVALFQTMARLVSSLPWAIYSKLIFSGVVPGYPTYSFCHSSYPQHAWLFSFTPSHLSLFSKVPIFLICLAYFLSLLLEWKFQEGWDFCLFYLSL